jgi:FkbM family methyltransferase
VKKLKRTNAFQRGKTFLKRLIGREIWLRPEIRVNKQTVGGWVICPQLLSKNSVIYSLGIGEDIAFDLELVRQFDLVVHGFDPTPNSADWLAGKNIPDGFAFHPWAVAARDGMLRLNPRVDRRGKVSRDMYTLIESAGVDSGSIEVPAYTVESIMSKLNHDRLDILKMDIEGAEYDVIDGLLATNIRPDQLLIEFHHRFPGIGKSATVNALKKISNEGYKIFDISITGREISFVLPSAVVA